MLMVVTERKHKEGCCGAGSVLFFHQGACYTGLFSLWKFFQLYTYMCIFMYIQDISMKSFKTHTHNQGQEQLVNLIFLKKKKKSWLVKK